MNSLKTSLALALIAFAGLPFALPSKQAPPSTAKPEDQILQLERDWLAASIKGDIASLRRIVADDFMGESRDGRLLSKEDVIPREPGAAAFEGALPTETNVRVFGDTAVLMSYLKVPDSAGLVRVTHVYQKRGQGWHMIAMQLGNP
jgi:ketosteroid isomerase-like protein